MGFESQSTYKIYNGDPLRRVEIITDGRGAIVSEKTVVTAQAIIRHVLSVITTQLKQIAKQY